VSAREKTLQNTMAFVHAIAQHRGWKPNPDSEFVGDVASGLTTNYNRFGYFLCPCRDGDGERSLDRDIICPCHYAEADIAEYGHCFCGLYLSVSFPADKSPQSIPERRAV